MAILGIVNSRKEAQATALQEFRLEAIASARSLEAVLASRRGDFIFLSQSPPLANALSIMSSNNPMTRRWGRLDVQGSLLLFLVAHPEVESILLRDASEKPVLAVGRRDGAPVILSLQGLLPLGEAPDLFSGSWVLGSTERGGGSIETVLSIPNLIQVAAPAIGPSYLLKRGRSKDGPLPPAADPETIAVPVQDPAWSPPVSWQLVRRENESRLIQSVAMLAGRYRTTVLLNLMVMSLALIVGALALRQVRQHAALESERQHQGRLREFEKKLMESERLAGVGRLAAGIAHEINNPLEGMSNYLTLLEDDISRGTKAESLDTLQKVRQGLESAAGIIRQVLTYSDPGTAPQAPLNLTEVLGETVEFVRSNPAYRNVSLSLQTPSHQLRVLGNRVTLSQVFLNLLINACQHQASVGKVDVRCSSEGAWALVVVEDQGPGIPDDVLPYIFEPFYSTRGSTGLGLSVCQGIVSQHRGEITAENRSGGGACFKVKIPLTTAWVVLQDLTALSERV
jgi:signal transduction histidine kinase